MLCGSFLQHCMLFRSILVLFFFRLWLRLETTSRWIGSEFSCHWCCFPRRWFAVNSLCSSWFQDLVYGGLTYMLFFIARGWFHGLLISFCLFLSLFFSHLVAPFIVDHVSCDSFFRHICYSRFGYCFLCVCFVHLEGCFIVSSLSFGFSVVGFHSPPLRFYIFFSCISWCRCAEWVFWSFGFFYLEFCGSSLAWAPCMCLFSLWGVFYLLAGGRASGVLDMRLFFSWWLCSFDDYYISDSFFWFFAPGLDRDHLCSGDFFISYFIFLLFSDICLF